MDPFDLRLWEGFTASGGDTASPAIIDQITIDSRRIDSKDALFIALEGKTYDGHQFIAQAASAGARYAIAKKGWDPKSALNGITILYVDSPLIALQQIAGSYRQQFSCTVVGITGSFGKTMVKDLLQKMTATTHLVAASPESFNSQIGVPLSLLTIKKSHTIALIEAGISHKNDMDSLSRMIAADCGIVTHIGKKHISTLGSLDTAAKEMLKLLSMPAKKKWAIIPRDPHILPYADLLAHECLYWNEHSTDAPHAIFSSDDRGGIVPYHITFPDGYVHRGYITSGFYYFLDLINITAKAAWMLRISSDAISSALKDYAPQPMRTEIWKSPIGITFVNDAYCSDPQSVDIALNYLQQAPEFARRIFLFGGTRGTHKHLETDYRRIGKAIVRSRADLLLLYGNHPFAPLADEVKSLAPATEISFCPDYKGALEVMKGRAKANDIVLIKGDYKQPLDSLTEAFNDSICNNQCLINLADIASNITAIRSKLPPCTRIMVMVKALAYGTDEIRMAKFLETCGVDILGVSYVDEGAALKRSGVMQDIFVVNAAAYEAVKVVKWNLQIGASDRALIEAVASAAASQNKTIKVHLHVDTGMSRFGCRAEEAQELAKLIVDCPSLQLEGILTHLACADDPNSDAFTISQVETLDSVISELHKNNIFPVWKHAANSSGALRFHLPQYNMVRIGLAVYGLYSSLATKQALELRLALSLISRIVGINICKFGDTISYGRSYTVQSKQQRIAILPIGYFDGMHRSYSGKSSVIIRGKEAPMVGKICMDFMMVDVSGIPDASVGDTALIFGEDEYGHYVSPEELARRGDSIIHELITCLGPRIQRVFIYEENHHLH